MSSDAWSAPATAVFEEIRRALDAEETAVLATVAGVEGSAYRRPGAKMVVDDDAAVGSITAGCLEDEVVELAAAVRADGRPRVERFDLTGDDDVWGLGVGCDGVIDVLLEPLDEGYRQVVDAYEDRTGAVVYTVVDAGPETTVGDRAVAVGDDLRPVGPPDWVDDDLVATARDLQERDASGTVSTGDCEVFVDTVTPPPELVVFGSGHDVAPVVESARKVDFRVTVAGFRGAEATSERFPAAHEVRSLSPAEIREELNLGEDTYAVVMTHNFVDDAIAVEELLATDAAYVGLMGPRERFDEMVAEWDRDPPTAAEREKLYTPIGLDLGGGTPHRIAHSIVAELLAVHHDGTADHLRTRESIHGTHE